MKRDTYADLVTGEIIAALQAGTAPFVKPWAAGHTIPQQQNGLTGKAYQGINALLLEMRSTSSDPRWLTFKQCKKLGAQVIKGSKGTPIQFWIFEENVKGPQDDNVAEQRTRRLDRPILIISHVFHASQINGLEPFVAPEAPEQLWEPNVLAQQMLERSGVLIKHDQHDRAFYSPTNDEIHLPSEAQFPSSEAYYATALHELAHATGHGSRLDRPLTGGFGSPAYAREELRAEISSYLLAREHGFAHDPGQHMAYIDSWVSLLEDNPREILEATTTAKGICAFISDLALVHEQKIEMGSEDSTMAPEKKKPQQIADKMTFLNVPYFEKEVAKAAGATWHRHAKRWKADAGVDLAPLSAFLPKDDLTRAPQISARDEFLNFSRGAGLIIEELHGDGELHRVQTVDGKKGSRDGAYIFDENDGFAGGWVQNFRTDFKANWKTTGVKLTAEQVKAHDVDKQRARAERDLQIKAMHEKAAITAAVTFEAAQGALDHAYLSSKNLKGPAERFGCAVDADGRLLVPLRDIDGTTWGQQRIAASGFKQFLKEARVKGLFHTIDGKDTKGGALFVATGFATGAAIHAATGETVICAMTDSNLRDVVSQCAKRTPEKNIIICADNDAHLVERGKANAGLVAAESAKVTDLCFVVYPKFRGKKDNSRTDFADLLRDEGVEAVRRQVLKPTTQEQSNAIENTR